VRKRSGKRGLLLLGAILLAACGVAWSVLNENAGEGVGAPVEGYVVSVTRDSVGCPAWIPFAAKDCRQLVRMRLRLGGPRSEMTYIHVGKYSFLPAPAIAGGDQVSGSCGPTGQCRFEQLRERPWGLYGVMTSLAGIALVAAWLLRSQGRGV
jgi:hypothetical protein